MGTRLKRGIFIETDRLMFSSLVAKIILMQFIYLPSDEFDAALGFCVSVFHHEIDSSVFYQVYQSSTYHLGKVLTELRSFSLIS